MVAKGVRTRPAVPRGLTLLGRIAPGGTVTEAQAELNALAASFAASSPTSYPNGLHLTVRPLGEVVTRDVKPALVALSAAVGFVLLDRVRQRRQPARGARQDA